MGLVCGKLLGFGDVGTAVFSIVDALALPSWLIGERLDDLDMGKGLEDLGIMKKKKGF